MPPSSAWTWRGCAAQEAGPRFGCELAIGLSTTCLQGLNILLDSAADLRTSLNCLVRYQRHLGDCLDGALEQGPPAALVQRGVAGFLPHHYALDALTLTLVRNMARRLGRPAGEVFLGVQLSPEQQCQADLQACGIAVRRGPVIRLEFAPSWLAQPLRGRNEFLHHALRQRWEAGHAEQAGGGNEALRLARFWLKSSDQPIEQIAARIGYSQASNFIRAFRKHYGVTPKQFRLSSGG